MTPLTQYYRLLNLTAHSFEVSPRRVLFFDPLSDETYNGLPVVR